MSASREELCLVKKSDRKFMTAGPMTISNSNSGANINYTIYYILSSHKGKCYLHNLRRTLVRILSKTSGPEGTVKFCTLRRASVARE